MKGTVTRIRNLDDPGHGQLLVHFDDNGGSHEWFLIEYGSFFEKLTYEEIILPKELFEI